MKEYNDTLIENKIELTIIEYIKDVNTKLCNIDISFIDDFMNLVDRDVCCIPHVMLYKYSVD